jgi:tyrosine-protein kinase Etk/Wzc
MTPGLIDHLRDNLDLGQIIKAATADNLFVLPCGTRGSGAPELLVTQRMSDLVAEVQQRFDVVIIDSPPFVAGMDAYALAAAAGSMLIVLRPNQTNRKLARAKLEVLDRLPIQVLGTVLNGVPDSGDYQYYSNDYRYADSAPREPGGNLSTPRGLVLRG